jgi:UDP-galactopyranose mutase
MSILKKVGIVGAGMSGASAARILADRGVPSTVFEMRNSVGGMCREICWNGMVVPELGPHIFRTLDLNVWEFLERFCTMVRLEHRVATKIGSEVCLFPPLEHPLHETPLPTKSVDSSVGEYLVRLLGTELYEKFYESYTKKRWGISAFELSAEVIPLIPVYRTGKSFFAEGLVGIPNSGYTNAIENMLDDKLIDLRLGCNPTVEELEGFQQLVWTGRVDQVPDVQATELHFRCVEQEFSLSEKWELDDIGVINYPGPEVKYIRQTNYSNLLPWRPSAIGTEFAGDNGYPAYPILTAESINNLRILQTRISQRWPQLFLHGRLGRFEYISMDQAIQSSMELVDRLILFSK